MQATAAPMCVCVTDDGVGWLAACAAKPSRFTGWFGGGLYTAAKEGLRGPLC